MNIAFIHNHFPAGGAERVTLDIARYLQEDNRRNASPSYHISVFATALNSELMNGDASDFVKVYLVPKSARARAHAIETLVRTQHIDILIQAVDHIHDMPGIRRRTGVKLVFANHGEPFWQRYSILARRQNSIFKRMLWKLYWKQLYLDGGKARRMAIGRSRKIYDSCDVYTVLCEAYKDQTCREFGILPEQSHVVAIENSEKIRPHVCLDKEKVILYCGRLDNLYKRVDRLLRIWKVAQAQLPQWRLWIVGDGPDRAMLENLAKNLELKNTVFHGEHWNVQKYYDRASILCLTSSSEGWGLCLTEAQASGVIPIAFQCTSGVQTILQPNGVNGFLVKNEDEEEYVRTLVRVALMSDGEKKVLRQHVISKSAEYAPEIISRKWKVLFDSLQ